MCSSSKSEELKIFTFENPVILIDRFHLFTARIFFCLAKTFSFMSLVCVIFLIERLDAVQGEGGLLTLNTL